jgi:hypothetical protein
MDNIVYYPEIELDIDYLIKLVSISKPVTGRPNHHRLVEDDVYMTSIRNKYMFLSPVYNVYVMPNGLPVHTDAGRKCTLNIPLVNYKDTLTIVYQHVDTETVYDSSKVVNELNSTDNLTELYRFELNRPILFNTTYPHEVVTNGKERISISWSLMSDITFDNAIKLFNECVQD